MINILKTEFLINDLCWIYKKGEADLVLACCDKDSPEISLFNGKGSSKPLAVISSLHSKPVNLCRYNSKYEIVVSVDEGGMIEYWEPLIPNGDKDDDAPGFSRPAEGKLTWELKSETDLYEFKKVSIMIVLSGIVKIIPYISEFR